MPSPGAMKTQTADRPNAIADLGGRAPAVDIPVLKKKEKDRERKGAGFFWSGSPAAVELSGSAGQGLLGSGRLAYWLAQLLGGPSTWLGGLLLSKAGPWLVLAGLAALLAGALAAGAWLMSAMFPSNQAAAYAPPSFQEAVGPNGIKIRKPQDYSLSNLTRANQGAVKLDYDPLAAQKPENKPEPKAEEAKPAPAQDANALAEQLKAKLAGLDPGQFGGKLSGGSGPGGGGAFGAMANLSKNLLSGPGNAFQLKTNFVPAPKAAGAKKLTAFAKKTPLVGSKMGRFNATSSKAMGQLKLAKDMSAVGAAVGSQEAGHTYANNAFDQQGTTGGKMPGLGGAGMGPGAPGAPGGIPSGGNGVVNPPGTGAPNPIIPPNPGTGGNVTPWQPQIGNAAGLTSSSGMLKIMSMLMIAAGIALISQGWPVMMAGIALVMIGLMMLMQSGQKAGQASRIGNQIAQQYGQQSQGAVVANCSSQAYANGTQPQNCQSNFTAPQNNVHQAVTNEMNAGYNLSGGEPINK